MGLRYVFQRVFLRLHVRNSRWRHSSSISRRRSTAPNNASLYGIAIRTTARLPSVQPPPGVISARTTNRILTRLRSVQRNYTSSEAPAQVNKRGTWRAGRGIGVQQRPLSKTGVPRWPPAGYALCRRGVAAIRVWIRSVAARARGQRGFGSSAGRRKAVGRAFREYAEMRAEDGCCIEGSAALCWRPL